MRKVINDPAIEVVPDTRNQRPGAPPSSIESDAFHQIEAAYKTIYGVTTIPYMSTGATDMAFLRAKREFNVTALEQWRTKRMPQKASARTAIRSASLKKPYTSTCSSSGRL